MDKAVGFIEFALIIGSIVGVPFAMFGWLVWKAGQGRRDYERWFEKRERENWR